MVRDRESLVEPRSLPGLDTRIGALTVTAGWSLSSTSAAAGVGVAPRPLSLSAYPERVVAAVPTLGKASCDPARAGGGSRVLGGPMGRADSVQLGVASRLAPLRLLPRKGRAS